MTNPGSVPQRDDCWDNVESPVPHHGTHNLISVLGWPVGEEDGHLPHHQPRSDTFKDVLTHKVHGAAKVALVRGGLPGYVLHSFFQRSDAAMLMEADQVLGVVVVCHHSNAGARRTVALCDGDVVQQGDQGPALPVEDGRGHVV